jgi:hypothetical protein
MEAKYKSTEPAHALIYKAFASLPLKEHELLSLKPAYSGGTRMLDSAKLISIIGKRSQN